MQIKKFIHTQLLLNLFLFPVLVAYGLPISLLQILGNFLFIPIFTIFIFISFLIFISEILYMPNGFFVYLLELLTDIIYWVGDWGSDRFVLALYKPCFFILYLPIFILFFVIHNKKINFKTTSSIFFITNFLFIFLLSNYSSNFEQIDCNSGKVTIVKSKKEIYLIDPGYIGERPSYSWVDFQLTSELAKKFGTTRVDNLILLKPGKILFDIAIQICFSLSVKNVYLVKWEGLLDKKCWFSFKRFRNLLKSKNINLIKIDKEEITLGTIKIIPIKNKFFKKKNLLYPFFKVVVKNNNEIFSKDYVRLKKKRDGL